MVWGWPAHWHEKLLSGPRHEAMLRPDPLGQMSQRAFCLLEIQRGEQNPPTSHSQSDMLPVTGWTPEFSPALLPVFCKYSSQLQALNATFS